jgi:hypothetical protein
VRLPSKGSDTMNIARRGGDTLSLCLGECVQQSPVERGTIRMRFDKGFFMISRELVNDMADKTQEGWLLVVLMANMAWKDEEVSYLGFDYQLKPRELVTTYRRLRAWTGWQHRAVKRVLDNLVTMKLVRFESVNGALKIAVSDLAGGGVVGGVVPGAEPVQEVVSSRCPGAPRMNTRILEKSKNHTTPPKGPPLGKGGVNVIGGVNQDQEIDEKASNKNVKARKPASGIETPPRPRKARERAKKARVTNWPEDHPFSSIFEHLMAEKQYAAVFDLPADEANVREWIDRYKIPPSAIEELAYQYRNWCSSKARAVRSPRGTMVTFIRNYVNSLPKKTEGPSLNERIEAEVADGDGLHYMRILLDGD